MKKADHTHHVLYFTSSNVPPHRSNLRTNIGHIVVVVVVIVVVVVVVVVDFADVFVVVVVVVAIAVTLTGVADVTI